MPARQGGREAKFETGFLFGCVLWRMLCRIQFFPCQHMGFCTALFTILDIDPRTKLEWGISSPFLPGVRKTVGTRIPGKWKFGIISITRNLNFGSLRLSGTHSLLVSRHFELMPLISPRFTGCLEEAWSPSTNIDATNIELGSSGASSRHVQHRWSSAPLAPQ